jgi:hypothetical protein
VDACAAVVVLVGQGTCRSADTEHTSPAGQGDRVALH